MFNVKVMLLKYLENESAVRDIIYREKEQISDSNTKHGYATAAGGYIYIYIHYQTTCVHLKWGKRAKNMISKDF